MKEGIVAAGIIVTLVVLVFLEQILIPYFRH